MLCYGWPFTKSSVGSKAIVYTLRILGDLDEETVPKTSRELSIRSGSFTNLTPNTAPANNSVALKFGSSFRKYAIAYNVAF